MFEVGIRALGQADARGLVEFPIGKIGGSIRLKEAAAAPGTAGERIGMVPPMHQVVAGNGVGRASPNHERFVRQRLAFDSGTVRCFC